MQTNSPVKKKLSKETQFSPGFLVHSSDLQPWWEWTSKFQKCDWSGIRTHAPEEIGALIQRLRPLGHPVSFSKLK